MSETRGRILAAAREIYLREGSEGVTMRSVAARVGVTPTALYRHFENKRALEEAVVAQAFETFGGYLHRALGGETPAHRLRLSGEAYRSFALEQREMYLTIFMTPPRNAGARARKRADARRASTFRFLVDRVEECMRAGVIAKGDAEGIATTLWAHVHGLVSLYIAGAIQAEEEEFSGLYGASLAQLFDGLGG